MALKEVSEYLVENIWLHDKESCDIAICVMEKPNVDPPIKRRICFTSAGSDSDTKCDAAATHVLQQGRMIKLHTISKRLVRSPYFETYLKESWSKQEEREGSSLEEREGSPLELPLEMLVASPHAYQQCIKILCSSEPCSAHMFTSPLEAVHIYLASDHLLFKECSAACMDYLASVPWSNEERKVISKTFSTSDIKPSEDVAARLGLSKENPAKNLSEMLWYFYDRSYHEDENGIDDFYPGGAFRMNRFQDLLNNILQGYDTTRANKSSKKTVTEFLYRATDDCVEKLKNDRSISWLDDRHFLGWLHMIQWIMDITDGKRAVEALACNQDLHDLFFPTFTNLLEEHCDRNCHRISHQFHWPSDLTRYLCLVQKVVKLLAESFRRVAETEIIVPESTRNGLIMRWLPWLEKFHKDKKICEIIDIPSLKGHVSKILQTLSMDDEDLLFSLARGAMEEEYFLEGALKTWCERFRDDED